MAMKSGQAAIMDMQKNMDIDYLMDLQDDIQEHIAQDQEDISMFFKDAAQDDQDELQDELDDLLAEEAAAEMADMSVGMAMPIAAPMMAAAAP